MSVIRRCLAAAALLSIASTAALAQIATTLVNQAPEGLLDGYLLTDGTVLYQGGNTIYNWYKLTPDTYGSYLNGTWSQVASLPQVYGPYAGTASVLADGRLLLVGGEYTVVGNNLVFDLTNQSAVFDPVANGWTLVKPPGGWGFIGDSPGTVLPNGRFLLGQKITKRMAELDPRTLTWTEVASTGKRDHHAEEGWTLLPDGTIVTVDVLAAPHTERYVPNHNPALGQWNNIGTTPTSLKFTWTGANAKPIPYGNGQFYTPAGEVGPAILRPDGTVFATGALTKGAAAGHTAIYHPGARPTDAGVWTEGPDFAKGDDAGDEYAVLLPNGHVLVEANTDGSDRNRDQDLARLARIRQRGVGVQPRGPAAPQAQVATATPTFHLYEFDGATLTLEPVDVTGGSLALLVLPTGEVSVGGVGLYTPTTGNPAPDWAPVVTSYPRHVARGGSYEIFGRQFNGLSQAAAFGDEDTTPTNYPLVRITNGASGRVVYARTHDHSTMGVATGARTVSTHFDLPDSIETGFSLLEVVANGIPSRAVYITID